MAKPRLRRLSALVRSSLRAYGANPNRKPLARQAAEMLAIARAQRILPYHYFVLGLYDRNITETATDFLPATMMTKYMHALNPRPARRFVDDKLLFRRTLEDAGLPVVTEIFRILRDGTILDARDRPLSVPEAREAIAASGDDVFVKPIDGTYGAGAFVPGAGELDALPATARNVLVQPRLVQHPAIAALHPASVNTVRIDTLATETVDMPATEAGFVHNAAVLRVGVDGSVVDNRGAGGIVVGIDLETGRLRRHGRQQPKDSPLWRERHPQTGAAFGAVTVPHWQLLRETVVRGAEALRPHGLDALGWDVALLPDGVALIEANCNWGSVATQIGWGGLAGTEIGRRARRHHGLAA